MFNVSVINIRKLIKYIFFFTLAIILYFIFQKSSLKSKLTEFFSSENSAPVLVASSNDGTQLQASMDSSNSKGTTKFSEFILNQTIPGLSIINNQNQLGSETSYFEGKSSIQFLLGQELTIMNSINLAMENSDSSIISNSASNGDNSNTNSNSSSNNNSDTSSSELEHAQTNVETTVIDSGVPNKYTNSYNGVTVKNGTNYTLTDEILSPDNISINQQDVMIFHTHTCESYTPTENFPYEESGTFRTTDLDFSVSRVGDALSDQLLSYGFNVVHDKTYHDYPAYSGSYGRSQATVENLLVSHPGTDIIIDLHRDAIADTSYAPSVIIGDETVAQLMFVIGTDGGGLEHLNWQQNLKFAVKVQEKANELYPGLFRPILLRNSRYNQQLGKAACIIEVGATGNTLEQAMGSMKYLAKILDEVLKN